MRKNVRHCVVLLSMIFLLVGCSNTPSTTTTEQLAVTQKNEASDDTLATRKSLVHDDALEVQENTVAGHTFSCSYEGVKHDFILEQPSTSDNAPLVLMLHGYGESAEAFRTKTAFHQDANEQGFAVVYVTGAPSPEDVTSSNGWNSGVGENSNDDVGFLCTLSKYLCETYHFDSSQVYAVGFSNGAFMTHRLAMEASDVFSSVVCVAGMMPESIWEKKTDDGEISVFQVTGEKDDVVPQNNNGSAKYAQAPAIEEVMEYYVERNGLMQTSMDGVGKNSTLVKYSGDGTSAQVWDLFIPDGRHAWPDQQITGIDLNHLILEYFKQ